jgi:hypothetical protein
VQFWNFVRFGLRKAVDVAANELARGAHKLDLVGGIVKLFESICGAVEVSGLGCGTY